MIGYAPDGKYLSVSPDNKDWHIRLTRSNKKACNELAVYHGRVVTAHDMRQFLPTYHSLPWQPGRNGVGPCRAITADAGEFRVALIILDGCDLPDEQVICEFRQFLSCREE